MKANNGEISVFEAELQDVIPICHATIAGTRIIGRLTAGYVRFRSKGTDRAHEEKFGGIDIGD